MTNYEKIDRRSFLKIFGAGAAVTTTATFIGCDKEWEHHKVGTGTACRKMTDRINPNTKDKVSILGYGMMRLPQRDKRRSANRR